MEKSFTHSPYLQIFSCDTKNMKIQKIKKKNSGLLSSIEMNTIAIKTTKIIIKILSPKNKRSKKKFLSKTKSKLTVSSLNWYSLSPPEAASIRLATNSYLSKFLFSKILEFRLISGFSILFVVLILQQQFPVKAIENYHNMIMEERSMSISISRRHYFDILVHLHWKAGSSWHLTQAIPDFSWPKYVGLREFDQTLMTILWLYYWQAFLIDDGTCKRLLGRHKDDSVHNHQWRTPAISQLKHLNWLHP